ncbi:hypothetical protein ACOMHN_064180 [Nucella lapillus]
MLPPQGNKGDDAPSPGKLRHSDTSAMSYNLPYLSPPEALLQGGQLAAARPQSSGGDKLAGVATRQDYHRPDSMASRGGQHGDRAVIALVSRPLACTM